MAEPAEPTQTEALVEAEGPWTEISVNAYNIRKLSKEGAERVRDRIVDELQSLVWDEQDEYDKDEEDELADFDISSSVQLFHPQPTTPYPEYTPDAKVRECPYCRKAEVHLDDDYTGTCPGCGRPVDFEGPEEEGT